jgi:DNA-directed RNA polymerase specialized sigma24 family protein
MAKQYRALAHTYVHPAPTQEQAAEILDMPFSTYRRHLKEGIDHITEILWQEEIGK